MTLEPTIVADVLANLFGAAGAFVLAREAHRADPFDPVTKRIDIALRFVAVFFLMRAFAWAMGDGVALHAADLLAASTPLVSLIVAEGLLRRHAPHALKLALIAAPIALILVKLTPFLPEAATATTLIASVVGGYLAITVMLWRRDSASLSEAENASVRRVLFALLVLAPLIMTDFRSVWPDVPVRLGAVGALLLLYLGFGTGQMRSSYRSRLGTVAVFIAIAALLATGYAMTGGSGGAAHLVRVAAVGLAGLLLAATISEARGAASERNRPTGSLINVSSVASFEAGLRDHPLLSGAHVLQGAAVAHVQDPALDSLFAQSPVLRRSAAPWGRAATDDGVERAISLMAAHDATDLAVVTRSPLRVLALAVPPSARDARGDADIQLARLVGELVYTKADRP